MKVLQNRDKRWFLDQRRIVSETSDLCDAITCQERLSYATMRSYYLVAENYDEAFESLMGCFAAFLRFHENFTQPTRYVWINKDLESPVVDEKIGKNKAFIGELKRQDYREVRDEIKKVNARCLVLRWDWLVQFRDLLILTCY